MPPPEIAVQNLGPGSVSLSKWLQLPTGSSPIQNILPLLQPVQEAKHFQRRYHIGRKDQAVGIGQEAAFSWIVPDDQAWKLMLLWIQHDGLAAGGVVFQFRRNLTNLLSGLFYSLWEGEIDDSSVGEVVYPSAVQRARVAVNRFVDLRGNTDIEFFPGDTLSVVQSGVAVAAGDVRIAVIVEEIPIPEKISKDLVITSVALP